jgi:hypothetical protein
MPLFAHSLFVFEKAIYRLEDMLRPSPELPPESARDEAELPHEGPTISVETALNSRCSSDDDGNPRKSHWGMFDTTKKLSEEQIGAVVDLASVPRLTAGRMGIRLEHNIVTFLVDNRATHTQKQRLMVESGMQQQAVGLVCSALGVGSVIKNLGKDGRCVSEDDHATVRMRLDPMKASYDGAYWSERAPEGRVPWLRGNLPDPVRKGDRPLLATLAGLRTSSLGSEAMTGEVLSQLLWAARGRTPHLYKSTPWGLTIPTWGGKQELSSVYVISNNELSAYVNWHNGRPTHSLLELKTIPRALSQQLRELFPVSDRLIVIGKNEDAIRSLWEVGYQLFNILIQARAWDLSYDLALLNETQKCLLAELGIGGAVAVVTL